MVYQDNINITAEIIEYLPAGTAGRTKITVITGDSNGFEISFSFG
jgi:hypothetical protein